jgi:non-specific serine/threonine protein kinase
MTLVALPAAMPGNLPIAPTSFIGRAPDLATLARLLAGARLLTLTGPGGIGKTRLALELARVAADDFPDGMWLVELAALADPALVARAVATVLGVAEQADRPLIDTLTSRLAGQRLLLVLDNCEHLIDASAALADALLRRCPDVRLLATSREPLTIGGEIVWRVPPLTLPDERGTVDMAHLCQAEAARLFIERAMAVRPDFQVTATTAAVAVADICRRLDGLPLAIELAAARVSLLPVDHIADRLDDALRLLTSGSRTAPLHHRTLRATLDWSYALLTETERVLLRRLAVFAGGWTLAAAEAVAAGEGIAPADVLDLLGQVAHKSLVQVEQRDGEARYRLLETVRQYAAERLAEAGEEAPVRDRHSAWCLALAEQAEPALHTAEQLVWQARLEAEHDNLRAALAWCLDHAADRGLALAGWLWPYWRGRAHYSEGRRWLERLLDRAPSPTQWRARALLGTGQLAYEQGDLTTAHARLADSLTLSRALAETRLVVRALRYLAPVHIQIGDLGRARAVVEEGLALGRTLDEQADLAAILIILGRIEKRGGTFQRARAVLEEGLALARLVGDRWLISDALGWLGTIAHEQGDYQRARALTDEALAVAEEAGATFLVTKLRWQVASFAHDEGDEARATALYEVGLAEARQWQDAFWLAYHLLSLGDQARAQGDPARATKLLEKALGHFTTRADQGGAADARLALGLAVWQQGDAERAMALLRASLAARYAMGGAGGIPKRLEALATVAAGTGQGAAGARRAARLLGAAAALRQTSGAPLPPVDRPSHEAALQAARAALGVRAFAAAWASGQALSLEEAVAEALADDVPTAADSGPSSRTAGPLAPGGLTPREVEVLRKLAQGATDRMIASQLSISVKTVNKHVASILGKTDSPNRTAAAAFAVQHGLAEVQSPTG